MRKDGKHLQLSSSLANSHLIASVESFTNYLQNQFAANTDSQLVMTSTPQVCHYQTVANSANSAYPAMPLHLKACFTSLKVQFETFLKKVMLTTLNFDQSSFKLVVHVPSCV